MKQLVHDNVNTFLGMSDDKGTELLIVWRHCSRGTLGLFSERVS
jgi:guanylate cyclase